MYKPSTKSVQLIYASREDKPSIPEERHRVEKNGGKVYIPPPGQEAEDSPRVLLVDVQKRWELSLAMSRSLGDWDFSGVGVIAEPIVQTFDLDHILQKQMLELSCTADTYSSRSSEFNVGEDSIHSALHERLAMNERVVKLFAVAATDGLLDFVTPEDLLQKVATAFYDEVETVDNDAEPPLHPLVACERLILQAAEGWYSEMGYEYRDDIAIAAMKISL